MIVLCASFGSSAPEARRDIEAVEAALRAAFCAFIPIILQRRCIINSAANDFT